MYIVAFNGPPRSGKDTMARMLAEHMDSRITLPAKEVSLSMPLRKIAYAMTGFEGELDGPAYEIFKETLFPEFDRNGRELMIDISERFLKPCYEQGVMAQMLLADLVGFPGVVLIRDTGFQTEFNVLLEAVGQTEVYLVRMHREGCDFSSDSREYVATTLEHFAGDYHNNGSLSDLRTEAVRVYGRLVNQMAWAL